MNPLLLSHFTATSCIGVGVEETLRSLRERKSGLIPCDFDVVDLDTFIGPVTAVDAEPIRDDLRDFDCRNNRLAQLGIRQDGFDTAVQSTIKRLGRDRVGVFLGTSTSGILQTELAYRRRDPQTGALPADFIYNTTHNNFSVADFVSRYFDITGPALG